MRSLTEDPDPDDALIARHIALPPTRPDGHALVRLNMISSADGGTEIAGKSGGLGNRNDHTVFAALRAQSDAVLVGMNTVVADHYGPPQRSRAADLRDQRQAGCVGRREAVRVGPGHARPARGRAARAGGRARAAAGTEGRVDLAAVATLLAGRVVLMEGGPRLAGEMVALGLIDEFFHTVSPMVIVGESPRVMHGPPADAAPWGLMHGFCDEDGYLFLRYARG